MKKQTMKIIKIPVFLVSSFLFLNIYISVPLNISAIFSAKNNGLASKKWVLANSQISPKPYTSFNQIKK